MGKKRAPYYSIVIENTEIQFREDQSGEPLGYIRLENLKTGEYLGAIEPNSKELKVLKNAIEYLEQESKND